MAGVIGNWKYKGLQLTAWQGTDKISFTFKKAYKDKATGEWKEGKHLFPEEIAAAADLFTRAETWIRETGVSLNPSHTFTSTREVMAGIALPGAPQGTYEARKADIIANLLSLRRFKKDDWVHAALLECDWSKVTASQLSRSFWLQGLYLHGGAGDMYTSFKHWSQGSDELKAARQERLNSVVEGEVVQGIVRQHGNQQWVEQWDNETKKFVCHNHEAFL